jgi:D-arabinose 1-dehydrogenase-like Zn-dependent alcohol dehydrogenase
VSELGDGVTGVAVGDRVAVLGHVTGPGTACDGGFAPRVAAPAKFLVKIPERVSWDQAAASTDAGVTSYHAAMVRGEAKAGDRFGIIGMGGLGSLAVQAAVAAGANVYVAETKEGVHDYARELGVTAVSTDIADFGDEPFDAIVDFVGAGTTTATAVELVKRYGRVVLVGLARTEATVNTLTLAIGEVSLLGSNGGSIEDHAKVLELMSEGELHSQTTIIGFDEIGDAIGKLERGDLMGGRFVALSD